MTEPRIFHVLDKDLPPDDGTHPELIQPSDFARDHGIEGLASQVQVDAVENDAAEALGRVLSLEAKVGTGASTPDVAQVLYSTDDGGPTEWRNASGVVYDAVFANFGGALQKATVTLSSADILALADTPVVLVEAPGAGKYLVAHHVNAVLTFGTTQYTIGDPLDVKRGTATLATLAGMDGSSDTLYDSACGYNPTALSVAEDAPILLTSESNPTDGDGSLTVTIWYSIEDVP